MDRRVLIWHAASSRLLGSIETRHAGCIFGLRFARDALDHSIWSCSKDGTVFLSHVDGVCAERPVIRHWESALQVLTDPLSPHVVLSCSSDGDERGVLSARADWLVGTVRQVDSRHRLSSGEEGDGSRANVLIDHRRLPEAKRSAEVLTMDINPCRPELISTGGNESIVRSFDRRMLSVKSLPWSPEAREVEAVHCWSPQHLGGQRGKNFRGKVVTCVRYDDRGTSLLASFNRDRIYLLHPLHQDQFTEFDTDKIQEASAASIPSLQPQRGAEQDAFSGSDNSALRFLSQTLHAVAQRRPIVLSDDDGTCSNLTVDMDGKLRFNSSDLIHRSLHPPSRSGEQEEEEERAAVAAGANTSHAAAERENLEGDCFTLSEHDEQSERNRPDERETRTRTRGGKFSMRYQGHLSVRGLHDVIFFGSEEQYVASGSDDGRVYIWDRASGNLCMSFHAGEEIVSRVQSSPRRMLLATAGQGKDIRLWSPCADGPGCDLAEMERIANSNVVQMEESGSVALLPLSTLRQAIEQQRSGCRQS